MQADKGGVEGQSQYIQNQKERRETDGTKNCRISRCPWIVTLRRTVSVATDLEDKRNVSIVSIRSRMGLGLRGIYSAWTASALIKLSAVPESMRLLRMQWLGMPWDS